MKAINGALQAIWALSVLLLPVSASSNVFESLQQLPRGWTRMRSAAPDETVKLRLSLKQQNLDEFYESLLQVSTPDHPRYGKHYEGHELRSLLKPSAEASSVATSWLRDNGVTSVRDDGDYIFFRTSVATAQRMLDTDFDWYENQNGEELLRTTQYSVPGEVAQHINFVQPTTRFGSVRRFGSHIDIIDEGAAAGQESKWVATPKIPGVKTDVATAMAVNASCATSITPQCLMQLYNVNLKGSSAGNNSIGYASFVGQSARFADQEKFSQVYAPFLNGKNFSVATLNGGINDQTSKNDSGEANLDQQYVMALAFDMPTTEFITGGLGQLVPDGDSPTQADNTNEPFLEFAMGLLAMDNAAIPNSISISYGENEQEIPLTYANQVCNMFAQLGARGKTIIVASGDSGVGDFCLANDGTNATRFNAQFPAACPYVTSVGGTSGIAPETATFFSSGGFSNIWARPAYQDAAVSSYVQKVGSNFTGLFNASGRGFPDVAAQSVGFRVIDGGRDGAVRGTSAAAPTFNGLVGLLNTARIASGQPTMGFMNPFLYANASAAMNDVTTGTSTGCNGKKRFNGAANGSPVVPNAGWAASAGWDAVTGLGTMDFGKALAIAAPSVQNTGGVLTTA